MIPARLEHINLTVSDPQKTADLLIGIFDWHIRWKGPSQSGGNTIHVGEETSYLALYTPPTEAGDRRPAGRVRGGLNHVAVTVDDLDLVEARLAAAGIEAINHGDYDPGRRFYFYDHDGVEYEVVSYT